MPKKDPKLILILALVLGIGACQTGPQTGKAGDGKAGSGAISTLQQEDVLQAIVLEDEEFWEEAADAYLDLAKKYPQPEKSAFHIKTALMYYRAGDFRLVEAYFETLPDGSIEAKRYEHIRTP